MHFIWRPAVMDYHVRNCFPSLSGLWELSDGETECECFNYRRTETASHILFTFTNKSRSQYFSSGRDLVNF